MLEYRNLVDYFRYGCKKKEDFRLGLEWEQFTFNKKTGLPLPYEGKTSIVSLLTKLIEIYGWSPIYENDKIIALFREDKISGNKQNITLEPGGQIEISGALQKNHYNTILEVQNYYKELTYVCDDLGIGLLAKGFADHWQRSDFYVMPKKRYEIMKKYMPKVGNLGLDMMFRTCTTQLNLDYESEDDMIKKMRVSMAMQPFATAIFANSLHSGYNSYRAHIWTDTDSDRTGFLDFIWDNNFGFEAYTNYLLDVPMYFIRRNNEYIDCAGMDFKDFMDGKLPSLVNEYPTLKDWEDHASTAFPEVRLKQFLEMRGADSVPFNRLSEFVKFWEDVLYNQKNLNNIFDKISNWKSDEIKKMHNDVIVNGTEASTPCGKKINNFLDNINIEFGV